MKRYYFSAARYTQYTVLADSKDEAREKLLRGDTETEQQERKSEGLEEASLIDIDFVDEEEE